MKAGQLDRVIVVQRYTVVGDDGYGNQIEEWADLVTLRAQLIQAGTEEYIRDYGQSDETVIVFRTWFVDGMTTDDRVVYNGLIHDIKEMKEIGRRNGLEFRTKSLGQTV